VTIVWDLATATNIASLTGHGGEVNCVQADERRVITGGWDKTVKLWDPRSWSCVQTVRAHTWPVRCLQYDLVRHSPSSARASRDVADRSLIRRCADV
jgi:WD40 repeat protein